MTTLDVMSLPMNPIWNAFTGTGIALAPTVLRLKPAIDLMMSGGVIKAAPSFGYALADPNAKLSEVWDTPSDLIAMVVFWGPEGPRYAANAVRKIRASAREDEDTETIRRECPELFTDSVASAEDDGTFAWGDFPYDGAAFTTVQGRRLLGAVSALPKEEDPILARFITGLVGLTMWKSDQQLNPS